MLPADPTPPPPPIPLGLHQRLPIQLFDPAPLEARGVPILRLPGRDIWVRDFMPVDIGHGLGHGLGRGRYAWFRYEPDYLRDCSHRITSREYLMKRLPWLKSAVKNGSCLCSELNVDGGNVVGYQGHYLICSKVFRENRKFSRTQVESRLYEALQAKRIRFLPNEPGDPLGHADGLVRWIGKDTVLAADFRALDPAFDRSLVQSLQGLNIERFPYHPFPDLMTVDGLPAATGCYINFASIARFICLPVYGLPEDRLALETARRLFPDCEILPMPALELSLRGGVFNCITWAT